MNLLSGPADLRTCVLWATPQTRLCLTRSGGADGARGSQQRWLKPKGPRPGVRGGGQVNPGDERMVTLALDEIRPAPPGKPKGTRNKWLVPIWRQLEILVLRKWLFNAGLTVWGTHPIVLR